MIGEALLLLATTLTLPTSASLSSVCEDLGNDGVIYRACLPEAQHLFRSRNVVKDFQVIPLNGTCGDPPSEYCILGHADVDCMRLCNTSDPTLAHSPEMAADADPLSWWQSVSWLTYPEPLHIIYQVSFNKLYQLTDNIIFHFNSARPRQVVLERSSDRGRSWSVWQYYAKDCLSAYKLEAALDIADNPEEVICSQAYSDILPYTGGQVIFDVLARYERYLGPEFNNISNLYQSYNNTNWQTFLQFTDIRFRFLHPATDGEEVSGGFNLFKYYYAMSEIQLVAECFCHLHASLCHIVGGQTQCVCQHHTAGVNCEYCLPLYNNRSWLPGYYLPEGGTANECQKCECHGHADSCEYNDTLGHGVCLGCYDFTTSYFCHQCIDGYHINSSLPLTSPDICVDCKCDIQGTFNGDSRCDSGGVCQCKNNVRGDKCSQCAPHYYGLESLGSCQPCGCSKYGVIPGSTCDEVSGQCRCKATTASLTCSMCRPTFYQFPATFEQECLSCGCVPGASLSATCNLLGGQCHCLPNFSGRVCDTVNAGFYLPSPITEFKERSTECSPVYIDQSDKTIEEFTGSNVVSCEVGETSYYTIALTGNESEQYRSYRLGIRYKSITDSNLLFSVTSNLSGHQENLSLSVSASSGWFLALTEDTLLLIDWQYAVNITVIAGQVMIDTLLLAPDWSQFSYYASLPEVIEPLSCYDWLNSGRDDSICQMLIHSSMAELYRGAKECDCDELGTIPNTTCGLYGGQCHCQPRVKGRRCDMCLAGYHSMTSTGCKECSCNLIGSEHNVCSSGTGQCPCKQLVASAGQFDLYGDAASLRIILQAYIAQKFVILRKPEVRKTKRSYKAEFTQAKNQGRSTSSYENFLVDEAGKTSSVMEDLQSTTESYTTSFSGPGQTSATTIQTPTLLENTNADGEPILLYAINQTVPAGVRFSVSIPLTEKHWQSESGAFFTQSSFLWLSCEMCQQGNRRANSSLGSLSPCIPCDCNERTDGPPACHPLTG
ncbi:laminin subunit beta-4-like [Watersipora subatra]|uniref:laminin subunit beta-4-like n=1 Tax=Watersipora subatra TaxID=2589382 RepID=UPI00355B3273